MGQPRGTLSFSTSSSVLLVGFFLLFKSLYILSRKTQVDMNYVQGQAIRNQCLPLVFHARKDVPALLSSLALSAVCFLSGRSSSDVLRQSQQRALPEG